ncbi:MAG: c-type cytochrome [Acidobacteriota bacterium]
MERSLDGALTILLLGFAALAVPQDSSHPSGWDVPEEARAVENPVPLSPEVLEAGATLYEKNCVMCHGESAKGDGPATQFVKPAPPDISTAEARARMTDGEIFYKITVGKKPMPAMNKKLTEEERWKVIHYLRSLQAKE